LRFLVPQNSEAVGSELFHPGKCVEILAGKERLGFAGLVHPKLARELKFKTDLYLADLNWDSIQQVSLQSGGGTARFKGWSEFPSMERDFALLVKSDLPVEKILQTALKAARPLAKTAKVFDVYQGSQVPQGMTSVAVRVIFLEEARSLEEVEVEKASQQILEAWKKELGIELRG
jgi:phenylalanyl-tRNA synthetase beta chain